MIQKIDYKKIKKKIENNLKIIKNSKPHLMLKVKLITKNGFFYLERISGLRIHKIGDILKGLRQKTKITQKELAEILKVSQTTIRSWEKNAK
ncbi:MAG: helix-turn-helix transcriptional regulator [Candidatus Aenigmatarchaeota archaeon]